MTIKAACQYHNKQLEALFLLIIVLDFLKHTFLGQFSMENSISLFKFYFCTY
jgi:hypothetical protein